jgi:hypothetical protein
VFRSRREPSATAPLYLDPSKPVDVRVDDLVSRMTLEEKASQLVNQARAIPRLQVPDYDWWSEAWHGVANAGTATVFPEPIGLAATFDSPLIHDMAVAIGIEARAKHNQAVRAGRRDIMEGLDFWSPNINIFRDPRWGRGQETYGEDPFLTERMGVAFVTGLQGDDPKYFRVISPPKHFAVHSGPEPSRHSIDVPASKHDMEDTYLPAFRGTVVEGKAESVMCAYNRLCQHFLLQEQLRGAWKFNGYVVSDCDALADMAESVVPPRNSPCLEYRMYLSHSGRVEVKAILAPTLNFVPGPGLRYAVSFDDQTPQIVDALAHNSSADWAKSVKDSVHQVSSSLTLAETGYHTLKFWIVDPGVVLQKMVVDLGGVSDLGPPESSECQSNSTADARSVLGQRACLTLGEMGFAGLCDC